MDHHKRELADTGFTILENYMGSAMLDAMRTRVDQLLAEEGAAAGSEFKTEENARRLANLVDKGEVFREAIARPEMLALVESVLGDGFKLSSLNMRSANPHSSSVQPFHVDMGALPITKATPSATASGCWTISRWKTEPCASSPAPTIGARNRRMNYPILTASHPKEMLVTGKAGTVVVMNAHAWHGGTANRTDKERRALHSFFCRHDSRSSNTRKNCCVPKLSRR